MEYTCEYASPLGIITLFSDAQALTGLYLDTQPRPGGEYLPGESIPVLQKAREWLDGYFRGAPEAVNFPLSPAGTPFQRLIWELLVEIPCGETRTYGGLAAEAAARMGKEKMSAQAVGQAVGRNPISIIIPCHRVIGAQGKLTGYAGGLDKKILLLRHEGHNYKEETP